MFSRFLFLQVSPRAHYTRRHSVNTLVRVPRDLLVAAEFIFNQTERSAL